VGIDGLKQNVFSGVIDDPIALDYARITSLKDATDEIVEKYEEAILRAFLQKNGYNKSQTARDLAITRKTLAQKIEKYQLDSQRS
jgi:DNA-binding NtrC family response regulator